MAFGLSYGSAGGSGDFLPIVKYDARAGRWSRIDREQGSDGMWASTPVDITATFTAAMDFANGQVGWLKFVNGVDKVLVPIGDPLPPRPSDDHRQGFSLTIKLGADCGGDLRELSGSSKAMSSAFDALDDQVRAAPEFQAGQIPIVRGDGATPIVTQTPQGQTTNYSPVLTIVGWISREQFDGDGDQQPQAAAPAPQPAPAAPPAPPPPAGNAAAAQF
jgi:hypothetical protein